MIEQRRNPTFGDERNYPFPSRFRPRGETWQPLAVVSHKSGGQRVRGMRVFVHACVTRDAFRVEYRRVSSKYWFWSIPVCLTAAPSYFPCISLLSSTIFTTPLRVTTFLPSLPSPMSTRIQRNNARYYECKYKESLPPLSFSFSSLFWMASRLSNERRKLEFGEKQSLGSSFHARVYVSYRWNRFDRTVKTRLDRGWRCCESFPRFGVGWKMRERGPPLLQISLYHVDEGSIHSFQCGEDACSLNERTNGRKNGSVTPKAINSFNQEHQTNREDRSSSFVQWKSINCHREHLKHPRPDSWLIHQSAASINYALRLSSDGFEGNEFFILFFLFLIRVFFRRNSSAKQKIEGKRSVNDSSWGENWKRISDKEGGKRAVEGIKSRERKQAGSSNGGRSMCRMNKFMRVFFFFSPSLPLPPHFYDTAFRFLHSLDAAPLQRAVQLQVQPRH